MSSKFEAAEAYVRLLPEGDKVIIIMRHQNALKWLRDLLISGNAVPFNQLGYVDGFTTVPERKRILCSFRTKGSEIRVLLITKLVGGCGLNLAIANHILNLDPDWVQDTDYQVECRVNRLGQTKRTFVLRFMVEGTLDVFAMRQQDAALIEQTSFYRTVFTDKFDKKCDQELLSH